MIPFRKSLGFRLLGISFILLALPLLVDSFILVQRGYRHTIEDAKCSLIEMAQLREIPLSQLQPLRRPLVEVLAHYLNLFGAFPQTRDPSFDEKLKKLASVGDFKGIFLIAISPEKHYTVTAASNPDDIGRDYTQFFKMHQLFSNEALEEGYGAYIFFDQKSARPFFMIAHPIYSLKEGRFIGLLALTDDITEKMKGLMRPENRGYQVNFALLHPSTIIFEATDPHLRYHYFLPLSEEAKAIFTKEEPFAASALAKSPLKVEQVKEDPFFAFTWNNEEQIGYIKKILNSHYSLLTYTSKREIFEKPLISFLNIYTVYGAILLVGGTLATLLTMLMAKPIQNLSHTMKEIQAGNLAHRYHKDPLGFEINDLGAIFNEMVDAVLEQQRRAEEERVKRETLASELRLGQQVQRSLLPQKMTRYPGVEVAEIYIPTIEVGGDFYDLFIKEKNDDKKLVLAVADASGKGVFACFYSLAARNMLRTFLKEIPDVAEAMVETNNLFVDTSESGMFVTVLTGVYDNKTQMLDFYSFGHNPGLIRREEGRVEVMEHLGMAMGVTQVQKRAAGQVQLYIGDTLIFYTDGITEAHNEAFELFGEERLIEVIQQEGGKSASELVASIVKRVETFAGKAPQHDDITLVVMKIIE